MRDAGLVAGDLVVVQKNCPTKVGDIAARRAGSSVSGRPVSDHSVSSCLFMRGYGPGTKNGSSRAKPVWSGVGVPVLLLTDPPTHSATSALTRKPR